MVAVSVGTTTCCITYYMRLRNGKMYSSTPTMEEEPCQFRPIMPVIEQVRPLTPTPAEVQRQAGFQTAPRLHNPMPTFTFASPTGQGPRAFIRSPNVFQPSTRAYIPLSEFVTPTTQSSTVVTLPSTTPVLMTPATILYTTTATEAQAVYDTRTNEAIFIPVSTPTPTHINSTYVPDTVQYQPYDTAVGENQPTYTIPETSRTFIPSTNTVASLKWQLNKLEAENSRLRKLNEEKNAELQRVTQTTHQQTEEIIKRLEQFIREGIPTSATQEASQPRSQPSAEYIAGPSTSRATSSSTHRVFSEDERLTGNTNFKDWAEAVLIELQVMGIAQVVLSEFAGATDWPLPVKSRADAVARSLILHSVDSKIRPQVRGLGSAYQMWNVLGNRYNVTSTFEGHKVMSDFDRLNFVQAGSALELIR